MFHNIVEGLRRIHVSSNLEAYYESLQEPGVVGGPTVDEARKDHRALLRSQAMPFSL